MSSKGMEHAWNIQDLNSLPLKSKAGVLAREQVRTNLSDSNKKNTIPSSTKTLLSSENKRMC